MNLSYARSKNLTPYDVLMIASLVEKEALAPDERPKIARVIYNRLHAHMNLGIDATIRYGLHVPGTKSLTQSELNSDNPYNTRNPRIVGLPPTPIANPGLAAIQAAAHPAPGDWLYFVRKPDSSTTSSRPTTRRSSATRRRTGTRRIRDARNGHVLRESAPAGHGTRATVTRESQLRRESATAMTVITASTRLVALLGHPVAHSLSPQMQNAAFAAAGSTGPTSRSTSPPERAARRPCAGSPPRASPART